MKSIRFFYPQNTLAVSVTGTGCALDCAHCGGHYLKRMRTLHQVMREQPAAASCLISGGCTRQGAVPFHDYCEELRQLKQGRRFNMHVGLVEEHVTERLAGLADCVSFDFIGDNATIREVLGLARTVGDYAACYQRMRRIVKVIPHICIGLHGGQIRGEGRALELLGQLGLDALTFLVFTPVRGSRLAGSPPPPVGEAVQLFAKARQLFPDIPIRLGCLRPGGKYRNALDQWAVRTGLDGIVNPAPGAVVLARRLGLAVTRGEECCAL